MSIIVKRGASIEKCGPEILLASIKIEPLYAKHGVDLVVTSGSEEYKHSADRSAHYRGDAQDWRIKSIPKQDRKKLLRAIRRKLGPDYVVLHEKIGTQQEHIHAHWSPVFGGRS